VPPFRRLFIGEGLSGLGDGFGFVAVAWLALDLAQPGERPYAVGLAIAAYSLPGALIGLAVASRISHVDPRRLLIADATLRGLLLGAIPILHAVGSLHLPTYIALLAGSSLLGSVGRGGYVSAIAMHVPPQGRFAANSLLGSTEAITVMLIGPALGGVLVATVGASLTIAIDAATFVALLWAALTLPRKSLPDSAEPPPRAKLRVILRRPLIGWLLALTIVFYGLYGPFETALPIFTHTDLHSGPALYGALWACLGAGAFIGSLAAGTRTVTHIERFALFVVAGWGVCVLVIGATSVPIIAAVGMAAGGLVYGPYPAVTTTSLQRLLPSAELAAGAAGWFALLTAVTPATTAMGGPLVAAIGARAALLISGGATIALAALVTAIQHRAAPRAIAAQE
jgi:predicted MFS family arabinose efflux permease